jgi:hypothetical protein
MIGLIALLLASGPAAAQARSVTIAIVEDAPSPGDTTVEEVKRQLE